MIDIALPNVSSPIKMSVISDDDNDICFEWRKPGKLDLFWISDADARRLYDALGAHLGVPPAEPDALTRIAVASERAADALEKLASFATDDVCDHGFTRNCPEGCC